MFGGRCGMASREHLPTVSVIVPVRNGGATLLPCLQSLLGLRYPAERLELIVVDNGSTDDTPAILAGFRDRLRVLDEPKRGAAAARNTGIRAARGDCIALTDADCVVDPDWLAELVQPLARPDVGVSGGRILSVEPGNRIERFGEKIHDHRRALEEFLPPYAISMSWASRRAVLLDVGLFDEALLRGQDVDLAWRIHAAGLRFVYRHDARIYHRNERTLRGLFAEGHTHGYFGVAVQRKHGVPLSPSMRPLLRDAVAVLRGGERLDSFFAFIFDLGKAMGRGRAWVRRRVRSEPGR